MRRVFKRAIPVMRLIAYCVLPEADIIADIIKNVHSVTVRVFWVFCPCDDARAAVMQAEADNPSGVYMLAVYPGVLTGVGVQDDIAKRKAAEGTFLGRLLDSIAPTFEVNVGIEVGISEI